MEIRSEPTEDLTLYHIPYTLNLTSQPLKRRKKFATKSRGRDRGEIAVVTNSQGGSTVTYHNPKRFVLKSCNKQTFQGP